MAYHAFSSQIKFVHLGEAAACCFWYWLPLRLFFINDFELSGYFAKT
jgi:hypothetical protein